MQDLHVDRLRGEFGSHFAGFHTLMPYRAQEILLVSSLYESFILEEDGLLTDLIHSEYLELNLSHAPRVTHVTTGEEALDVVQETPIDVVITMTRLGRWNVNEFAEMVKEIRPTTPVVVLADEPHELARYGQQVRHGAIDRVFVWSGDAKILLAIVKLIEDQRNVEHDIEAGNVRVIILVENSVRFFSMYIPLIYAEIMKLTQSLMAEGLNHTHRLLCQRARPKILLAENYEDAWQLYEKYGENLLGVISDVRFPRAGKLDARAGIELVRNIRQGSPYLPILMQSSEPANAGVATELRTAFLYKKSPTLLQDLRQFMLGNLGFGDFVFIMPDGTEVGRAHDLRSFASLLATVPEESLNFHARHNHFSNWLMARSEFELATRIRPKRVSDFKSLDDLRQYLLTTLGEFREKSHSSVIVDFSPGTYNPEARFVRIGGGSIGGKARGLAFIRAMLRRDKLRDRYRDIEIAVPRSAAIGTDIYERFLDNNGLRDLAGCDVDDEHIRDRFLAAHMPTELTDLLHAYLQRARYPLAVRSSSLLEDSQDQPFAGIYATYFLCNNHEDLVPRLDEVCTAIKLVYASTLFHEACQYLEATGHRAEEEQMGVILQEIVGSRHGTRFYPTFSGVVRSYNFYPIAQMAPEDGIANVALGLGKMVVEGGESLMFSPAHPHVLPQHLGTKELLDNSQRSFYALDLSQTGTPLSAGYDGHLIRAGLDVAETDGTLQPIGSVYSAENDMVYDGVNRPGPRVVSFAHVLKSGLFPLASILKDLLKIAEKGMGCPVEIEFAVDMAPRPMTFGVLQVRPITADQEFEEVHLDDARPERAVCFSPEAMGNGRIRELHDIIYVRPDTFDTRRTPEIASEITRMNAAMIARNTHYVLIGPGRWGSSNRWLGIPIRWDQISHAKVIVETSLEDFMPAPSQGTHLFQNLTAFRVSYLTVNPTADRGFVNWDWLSDQSAVSETEFLRHVRLTEPLNVTLDGRSRRGAIFKPGDNGD